MQDHATELRQGFIRGVDQTAYERMTLNTRLFRAQEYLRRQGLYFIEGGRRPNWGQPDPKFINYGRQS